MRILVTGTRDPGYPGSGVRLAFDLVRVAFEEEDHQPIVIVHGNCPSGVDDTADRLAPLFGWSTEKHPAAWDLCSPLCAERKPHRKIGRHGKTYCPMAGFDRNNLMVGLHHTQPYRLCIALPSPNKPSRGTWHCYNAAKAAGIKTMALDHEGHFIVERDHRKRLRS